MASYFIISDEDGNTVQIDPASRSLFVYLAAALAALEVRESALPVVTPATGVGAIAASYTPAAAFWLDSVMLHLSGAPTTPEAFTITLNANDGLVYDTLLYSLDLSLSGVTDLVYTPDDMPLLCEAGDAIDVAYLNSDGNTYGLRIVARLA